MGKSENSIKKIVFVIIGVILLGLALYWVQQKNISGSMKSSAIEQPPMEVYLD